MTSSAIEASGEISYRQGDERVHGLAKVALRSYG